MEGFKADKEITCTIYNFKDLGGGIKMCVYYERHTISHR